jgi:transposase
VAKLESLIRKLYDIEDQVKPLAESERLARRQSMSRHVLGLIDDYLGSEAMSATSVLPKSNLGQAAAYVRRHWEALGRYIDDASIPIDNNDCEQLMKRVATGRKNWLFKGSVAAGERAANLLTIVATALRNELDVSAYLCDVLRRALAGETDCGLARVRAGGPRLSSGGKASPLTASGPAAPAGAWRDSHASCSWSR